MFVLGAFCVVVAEKKNTHSSFVWDRGTVRPYAAGPGQRSLDGIHLWRGSFLLFLTEITLFVFGGKVVLIK